MKLNIPNYSFIIILFILNLILAIYATPISDLGDTGDYISLSKTILGKITNDNLQSRSPLYSIIMAGFMLIFKAPFIYKAMIIFQYFLVAVTAWLVFLSFQRLFLRKELAMLVALLFNLSFSTIYFANILLTEILTVFLLILSMHLLLRFSDQRNLYLAFLLGTSIGMLSLARFNAIPLIVTFFVLLVYALFRQKVSIKKWIFSIGLFLFSYALIINLWCLYNYRNYGFYNIYSYASVGVPQSPRNITIASIRPENIVSDANKPILEIFLKARKKFLSEEPPDLKGGLVSLDKTGILEGVYSGFRILNLARPELREYYKLESNSNSGELTSKLRNFLNEISAQNKKFIRRFRFFSFLNGFRASKGGSLPREYGKINLNFLPSGFFMIYKLSFLLISISVFFFFFFFLVNTIKKNQFPDITLLTMFFIVFSFWGINFLFYTLNDANRYKFPADPLIIGLFVYYSTELIRWIKNKKQHFSSIY